MKLSALLLFTVLPLTAQASTIDFEIGAGLNRYGTSDGRWYQEGQPGNDVTRTAPVFSLGVTGNVFSQSNWGVDWHASYVNLGRAAASCQCKTHDEDFEAKREGPTAYFTGSGRAQGAALTLEPYYQYSGIRLGLEAGIYAYHSQWSESIDNWSVGGPPQNLALSSSFWGAAPVVGISVSKGSWTLSYRYYYMQLTNARHSAVPPVWNNASVIEIKRRF